MTPYEAACAKACPAGCGKGLPLREGEVGQHFVASAFDWDSRYPICTAPTPLAWGLAEHQRAERSALRPVAELAGKLAEAEKGKSMSFVDESNRIRTTAENTISLPVEDAKLLATNSGIRRIVTASLQEKNLALSRIALALHLPASSSAEEIERQIEHLMDCAQGLGELTKQLEDEMNGAFEAGFDAGEDLK